MPIARHCLSLAAVVFLICGPGGARRATPAMPKAVLGLANRITAVYRVDLAGFNLGDFRLTTVFRGTDYEMQGQRPLFWRGYFLSVRHHGEQGQIQWFCPGAGNVCA